MLLGVLTFAPRRRHRGRAVPAGPRRGGDRRVDHRHVLRPDDDRQRRGARSTRACIASGVIAAILFYPVTKWLMDGVQFRANAGDTPGVGKLYLCALIGIAVTALLFVITDYYTSTRFGPVKKTSAAVRRPVTPRTSSRASAPGLQATALPALVLVARHPRLLEARRRRRRGHLRHRRRGHGPAVADRPDRRAGRLRADHRQRRRHRRDVRAARGGPRHHRPPRRGRQHDQGRHEGLRDRLGRARGGGAVRGLPVRARDAGVSAGR